MGIDKYEHVVHGFGPLYDSESRILMLGSIPSPKSREQAFYYGHPQNRFWKVMANVLGEDVPKTIEEKKQMMHVHHIALWDSLEECDICGASDSSIKILKIHRRIHRWQRSHDARLVGTLTWGLLWRKRHVNRGICKCYCGGFST